MGEIQDYYHWFLLVYVDNFSIFGMLIDINIFKMQITACYKVSDLGKITHFLRLHIVHDRSKNTLSISQEQYIWWVLTQFAMADCTLAYTPFPARTKLQMNTSGMPDPNLHEKYQQIVSSLMDTILCSHPDICFVVTWLTQYGTNPTQTHMNTALHVLWYLKDTHHYQLTYGRNDCTVLIGYSNSDWAVDMDDRRSTTGYCYTLAGACIAWQKRKQRTATLSLTEAEYMALTETTKHGQWAIQLLQQLDFEVDTIELYSDSLGACAIAENPVHHSCTKHIEIWLHYIRDAMQDGTFEFSSVPTKDNIADAPTKSFARDRHQFLGKKLGLVNGSRVLWTWYAWAISVNTYGLSRAMANTTLLYLTLN